MPSCRSYLAAVGAGLVALAGCSSGRRTSSDPGRLAPTSRAFADGDAIPARYTCDGANISPPVSLDAPPSADTWALVVSDPDVPGSTFTHWLIWNVPADRDLPTDVPHGETLPDLGGARKAANGFGDVGYGGPCPPHGDAAHRYRFDAYALGGTLDVPSSVDRSDLADALYAADLETVGTLHTTYERS